MIWLLFAHVLGDFALQTETIYNKKYTDTMWLIAHCLIWTGCICVALQFIGNYHLWKFLFLFTGHYIMDITKCKSHNPEDKFVVYFDQAVHLLQLLIVRVL
jgi:hypothetical protein